MPTPPEHDPFAAFVDPEDPWTAAALDDHTGVAALRAAFAALDAGAAAETLEHVAAARTAGVPAELVPHLAIAAGCALVLDGRGDEATTLLRDAWRDHPDVAALPALLGAARLLAEDATSAAHSMYAALVTEDGDRSLAIHRRRLTQLLGPLRQAR